VFVGGCRKAIIANAVRKLAPRTLHFNLTESAWLPVLKPPTTEHSFTFNTFDYYYIFTPKPDFTVGLDSDAFTNLQWRLLREHQVSGTILSDPHAEYMGIYFPFLVIETKEPNLMAQQNRAAVAGACMLRNLKDLEEATNLQSTDPPLCFSIMTEGRVHELWIHFEHEGAFHMEILRAWRTTFPEEAREFVQFLAKVMEWGAGRFQADIVAKVDRLPAVARSEHSG
jgi:hypothetical protein